jgi:hypothetical protein
MAEEVTLSSTEEISDTEEVDLTADEVPLTDAQIRKFCSDAKVKCSFEPETFAYLRQLLPKFLVEIVKRGKQTAVRPPGSRLRQVKPGDIKQALDEAELSECDPWPESWIKEEPSD